MLHLMNTYIEMSLHSCFSDIASMDLYILYTHQLLVIGYQLISLVDLARLHDSDLLGLSELTL
jgi:hypothetical protein